MERGQSVLHPNENRYIFLECLKDLCSERTDLCSERIDLCSEPMDLCSEPMDLCSEQRQKRSPLVKQIF